MHAEDWGQRYDRLCPRVCTLPGGRGGDVCCHATESSRPPTRQGRPRVPTTTRLSAAKYSCTALSHSQQHCLHCPLLLSHSVCRKRLTLFIAVTAVYFYITSADKMKQSPRMLGRLWDNWGKRTGRSYSEIFCPYNVKACWECNAMQEYAQNWLFWKAFLMSLFDLLSISHLQSHQHVKVSSSVLLMSQCLLKSGCFTLFSYLFLFRLKYKATLRILTKPLPELPDLSVVCLQKDWPTAPSQDPGVWYTNGPFRLIYRVYSLPATLGDAWVNALVLTPMISTTVAKREGERVEPKVVYDLTLPHFEIIMRTLITSGQPKQLIHEKWPKFNQAFI